MQDQGRREYIYSQCANVKEKLRKAHQVATFKLDVDRTIRSNLQPYFINAKDPEKVRIPSKAKFEQQVAYLAKKVWKAESKKDWETLQVHELIKTAIGKLVADTMKQYTPLINL